MADETSTTSKSKGPAGPRFTGKPTSRTVMVESATKNAAGKTASGSDAHEFVIVGDGFGHYRVDNAHDEAPWFTSEEDAIAWLTAEHVADGSVRADK